MNSELEEVKKLVTRWFERYKEMGDEMAVEMFMDDIDIIDNWAYAMLSVGKITKEEYLRLINFCDEKLEELKRIAGIERIDTRFR